MATNKPTVNARDSGIFRRGQSAGPPPETAFEEMRSLMLASSGRDCIVVLFVGACKVRRHCHLGNETALD
jgi:hypothetical protein